MDSALIYNPAFSTEENIEDQIIFSYGQSDGSELTQLGVAQGVVELANTFDGNPVSWLKTATHLVIVRQLEPTNPENWRHGYWFTCMLRIDDEITTQPDSFAQIVNETYRRWSLHNGPLDTADREMLGKWWFAFCENWNGVNESGAAGVYEYLRIKPGLLSPSSVIGTNQVLQETGAIDLLVTTFDDAAYIWSGSENLPYDSKLALQLWLTECAIAEDSAYGDASGYVYHLRKKFSVKEIIQAPVEEHEESSSWFNMSMPTLSMPSISLPSLTSLPSMPSFSLPTFSTPAPEPTEDYPETGFVPASKVYISNKQVSLVVYRRKMYTYTLIFDGEPKAAPIMQRSLDDFAAQLEAFNFAAAPPASFDYLVVDHSRKVVHSTLVAQDHALQEMVAALLREAASRPFATEQIARTAHNWWTYWLRLDKSTEVVFCNRWSPLDTKSLFGPLNSDSQKWINTYMPHLRSAVPKLPLADASSE